MMRLWAGWFTAALDDHYAKQADRPLLVVLDCKGGHDARRKADRTRRLLYGAGARRVAVWPDEARLSLWDLPPQDLAVLLYQMVETGEGNAAYYADLLYAVTVLAVTAPGGPPWNAASFLERLDPRWLEGAWGDGTHPGEAARVRSAARHIGDIQLRYATLLGRLGPALDGPGSLEDADAWYFILEGTREPSVAEAQAMALTELAARTATSPQARRARSCSPPMTTAPCPAACRCRTCTSAAGPWASACRSPPSPGTASAKTKTSGTGSPPPPTAALFVMHTPYPEPLSMLAGTRRVLETAHKLIGNAWGDEGTTRLQHTWTADPDLIRRLRTGQACYITHGTATYVHVARPRPSPLTLMAAPVPATPARPAPRRSHRRPSLPPASFDDLFGPGAAP